MAEFRTSATLEVAIDDRSLDEARAEIEDELGGVTVGVSGGTSGARADGGRPMGDMGDDIATLASLADDRNETLDELLDAVESGTGLGGGGGGGGGGGRGGLLSFVGGAGGAGAASGGGAAGLLGLAALLTGGLGTSEAVGNIGGFQNIAGLTQGQAPEAAQPSELAGNSLTAIFGPVGGLLAQDVTNALQNTDISLSTTDLASQLTSALTGGGTGGSTDGGGFNPLDLFPRGTFTDTREAPGSPGEAEQRARRAARGRQQRADLTGRSEDPFSTGVGGSAGGGTTVNVNVDEPDTKKIADEVRRELDREFGRQATGAIAGGGGLP